MIGQLSVSQQYLPLVVFLARGFPHPGHLTIFIVHISHYRLLDFQPTKKEFTTSDN